MSKEFSRSRRVGEQMQRELAQLIQQEIKDPRIGFVTVSAVDLSRDLSVAKVFISTLNKEQDVSEVLAVLTKASGFLRRELGRRMKTRIIPELRFVHDISIERGSELSALIDQAVASDSQNTNEDD